MHDGGPGFGQPVDFARGEALDDPAESDPAALARAVVDDARRGGGDIGYDGPATAEPVQMRPMAVQRALSNLVSNALRYGGNARVTVLSEDKRAILRVEDTGPGIPEDRIADMLEPFTRGEASRNRGTGGAGLGLAFVEDIERIRTELGIDRWVVFGGSWWSSRAGACSSRGTRSPKAISSPSNTF